MSVFKNLLERTGDLKKLGKINTERAAEIQYKTLKKLLLKAKDTEFGKLYGFQDILAAGNSNLIWEFQRRVPPGDYLKMLPWWDKSRQGVSDVTWPGKVNHFALSSGTSDGSSKYIPVTSDMLQCVQRASLRQVLSIARTDMPKDYLAKKWLMIGGSTELEYNGVYYSGDLSGITTGNIPVLFQRFSKPEPHIKRERDWKEKISSITRDADKWDVSMVAGVPAWVQLLFENILEYYHIEHIHEIWPNLEVYVHGGVSLKPYKKSIDKLLGRPIKYFETYLASEGFIAYQNRQASEGMRMLLRNGIFFEFIPFTPDNFDDNGNIKEDPQCLRIDEVEEEKEYALLMSTCAGAWRYLIGDVVKFTNTQRTEIAITGRTKHYISLCGEHLSVDNMNRALEIVSNELNIELREFGLAGIPYKGFFAHQWYIACNQKDIDEKVVAEKLDFALKILNDDYRVERLAALKGMMVKVLPMDCFTGFMESIGKLGGQNKFPRVLKGEVLEKWNQYLHAKQIS